MKQIDPTQFTVTQSVEEEVTFHDMVAEQLRHSPWLVLSAAAHAFVILLLWVLVPVEKKAPFTAIFEATSRSASSRTTRGFLPPISS